MPFYDYECMSCGYKNEELHSMTTKLTKCPKCGKDTYKKYLGSVSGLIFNGKGFYCNDYPKETGKS